MWRNKNSGAVETGETGYGFKLAIPKARSQAAHRQARGFARADIDRGKPVQTERASLVQTEFELSACRTQGLSSTIGGIGEVLRCIRWGGRAVDRSLIAYACFY